MKCDFCDQKATVFLTQLSDGEMKKHSLCESYAEERGVTDPLNLSMNQDFFAKDSSSPLDSNELPLLDQLTQRIGSAECPTCGFTIADLKKIGRLGCPSCYSTFRGEIVGSLQKMHKGQTHVGTAPAGLKETLEREAAIADLEQKLKSAIADEDYERAAKLRDAISAKAQKAEAPSTDTSS